jgi:hypothetical protein
VDPQYLTPAQRVAFKRAVAARRDAVGACIRRMEAVGWFTDDPVLQNLRSAYHALHAAVQVLGTVQDAPVKRPQPRATQVPNLAGLTPTGPAPSDAYSRRPRPKR